MGWLQCTTHFSSICPGYFSLRCQVVQPDNISLGAADLLQPRKLALWRGRECQRRLGSRWLIVHSTVSTVYGPTGPPARGESDYSGAHGGILLAAVLDPRDVQTRRLVVFRSCKAVILRLGGGIFRAAAGVTTAVVAPCGTGVRASFAKRSTRVNAMPRCCCYICMPCSRRLD